MLQQSSVLNLEQDSGRRHLHIAQTMQPMSSTMSSLRIPFPVSTIQFGDPRRPHATIIPRSGLDFLEGLPSVYIHQTFEFNESLSSIASENRYTVRGPVDDAAIFAASESSTHRDRTVWGSSRPYIMHLSDHTHQEVLTLQRKLSCSCFCCSCKLENLEVWSPPGDLLGTIVERRSLGTTEFDVTSATNEILFHINGPTKVFRMSEEANFTVLGANYRTKYASIYRRWKPETSVYIISISFQDANTNVRLKALLIGAAFLFEYKYFLSRTCC